MEIKVIGMSCDHCVRSVRTALEALPGAQNVSVDLAAGIARVDGVERSEAEHAIVEEGYDVAPVPG